MSRSGVTVDFEALHKVADSRIPHVAAAVSRALTVAFRSTNDLDAYQAFIAGPETYQRTIAWDRVAAELGAPTGTFTVYKAAGHPMADALAAVYLSAGSAVRYSDGHRTIVGGLGRPHVIRKRDDPTWSTTVATDAGLTARLDMASEAAARYAADRAGTLITALDREGLATVRSVMNQVLADGLEPARAGRLIRSTVGLNARQARALINYERGLWEHATTGRTTIPLRGLSRPLADQRYSISNLDRRRIDTMVDRYRERLINYRADMIARTETMRAANTGALNDVLAHGQGMGLFDVQHLTRIWVTVPDDRACAVCGFMDGQTVGMAEQFTYDGTASGDPSGDVMSGETPPIHPMCRCTVTFDVTIESLESAFAAGPIVWDPPPVDLGEWRDAKWAAPGTPGAFPQYATPPGYSR